MYDHEIRAQTARERIAQLQLDRRTPTSSGRTRHAVGAWLIRFGGRLTAEPGPRRRELSSRA
jgi:hypothetical protein